MFSKHVGGEQVKSGIYWSRRTGEFVMLSEDGPLAGPSEYRYIRTPLPIVLMLGPILGLAFAIFLPASGMMVLIPYLVGKIRGTVPATQASPARATAQRS
jgi:hypothetical protein